MESRWQKIAVALLAAMIWWPAALVTLAAHFQYARYNILLPYARNLGYTHSNELTTGEFAYVFSTTILFVGILLPAATCITSLFVNHKTALRATLVCAILLTTLSYTQLVTISNTGSLIDPPLLVEAATTAANDPEMAMAYVSLSSIAFFSLLLFSTCCIAFAASKLRSTGTRRWRRPVLFGLGASSCLFPLLFVYATTQHREDVDTRLNFVAHEFRALLPTESAPHPRFDELPLDALVELFQDSVAAPDKENNGQYWGAEKNSNVIIFNLETGPQSVIDYANDESFSTMRKLARQGFYSYQHYSTYPYTSDALFSLFGSLYPNNLRRRLLTKSALTQTTNNVGRLGLFNALARAGYTNGVYMQDALFEEDRAMLALFGAHYVTIPESGAANKPSIFETVGHLTKTIPGYQNIADVEKAPFERKLSNDILNLEKMLDDIRAYAASGQSFALAYLPLVGHGPWPNLGPDRTLFATGAAIFALQDALLARILETLDEAGLADDTIIVVTSDHGLRTTEEYPELRPGILNRISFNVPLIVRAPNVSPQPDALPYRTSHIDVAPTILALLGIDDPLTIQLGSPIWDSRIADRKTFVLANSYLGVDGYFAGDRLYAFHPMMKTATISEGMYSAESGTMPVAALTAQKNIIKGELDMQAAFQRAIGQRLLESATEQSPVKSLAKNP